MTKDNAKEERTEMKSQSTHLGNIHDKMHEKNTIYEKASPKSEESDENPAPTDKKTAMPAKANPMAKVSKK